MDKFLMLNERIFFRSPNINVCFKIRFNGTCTHDDFKTALAQVAEKHALLKCTIQNDNANNYWYIPNTGSISIEFHSKEEQFSWEQWYQEMDNIPFNFSQGPLIKLCILYTGTAIDMIIFGHHIIGDGKAYMHVAKDILAVLDGSFDSTPQTAHIKNNFFNTIKLNFFEKIYAKTLNNQWLASRHRFSEEEYHAFFNTYRAALPSSLYYASLNTEEFSTLCACSKSHGLTVNELLSSAFSGALLALKEYYPKNKIQLGIVIDIRNEITTPMPHSMGNFVSGTFIEVQYNTKENFIKNSHHIAKKLRKKIKNNKTRALPIIFLDQIDKDFIESIPFAIYGNYANPPSKQLGRKIGEQKYNRGMGVSNMGIQYFNTYQSFKVLDVLFIPPAFPSQLLTVGIITVNNTLNICLRYEKTTISDELAKELYHNAIKLIHA
ncbi:MAG: condensation domain-containing protein [Treponema sp.]|jgi:NRPS condensation-like uncharacterized protein|nr:condensation domain-containing protein [Treponema sp.]